MTLPPLPEPDTHCFDDDVGKDVWSHSPEQLHAYGEACAAAERERLRDLLRLVAEYASEPLVTCGGGPPGDPNGEQTAARILELEQNEARLETFIMQQDMRVGDLQKAVQRLKDLNNELFVSRCQAHMRTEQLEDFLRRMLEAATPQIGHAWKAEIRLALVEAEPDSKTPNVGVEPPERSARTTG